MQRAAREETDDGRRVEILLYGELLSTVTPSQVLTPACALRERGWDVRLTALTSPRRLVSPGAYRDRASNWRSRGLPVRLGWTTGRTFRPGLAAGIERIRHAWPARGVVHARLPRAALVADRLRRRRPGLALLLDLRGVRAHEVLYQRGVEPERAGPGDRRLFEALLGEEREAVRRADHVVCVSRPFRDYLREAHGLEDDRVTVLPCCVDPDPEREEHRAAWRRRLGLEEASCIFVYAGSLAAWQLPEATFRLLARLERILPQGAALVLTPDVEEARRLAAACGLERVVVTALPSAEVRPALAAADVGLLLRESHIVNRVASPVKFGEYLAAGLAVLATEGVGDVSASVREADLGAVLADPGAAGAEEAAAALAGRAGAAERSRRAAYATEHLSWASRIGDLEAAYAEARERRAAR